MGAFLGGIELDGQHRLGAVQCLGLRLLVHRQDDGPTWRAEVETVSVSF
jgi:hypothetical protein